MPMVKQAKCYLLNFGFFIGNVLARDGVVFFTLQFVGRITLVLHGGVKVAGIGAGNKFDFFTHNITPLYLFATTAHVCQHDINPDFVYHTHTLCRKA